MTEIITVSKVNKYGVRVGEKQYNYSKKYSGEALEVGKTYEAEIYTSETGAKYINSAKSAVLTASSVLADSKELAATYNKRAEQQETRTVANGYGSALSPSDKDTRILVQGILQAVLQSPTLDVKEGESIEDAVTRSTRSYVEFVRNFGK